MSNVLAKKYTVTSLLKFTAPTIIMMIFMSLYTMVDGVFVSRFVGTDALSAVNIVYPYLGIILAVGIMLATGGCAVIAKKMGEKNSQGAKENFSMLVILGFMLGVLLAIIGMLFLEPLLEFLGADAKIYPYAADYLTVLMFFFPLSILQMLFQYFFVTAGKPNLGLIATVSGGVANIVLDYVFIVLFDMNIAGAALATGIGYSIPALFGVYYFMTHKHGSLYFVKPTLDKKAIFDSCSNGASEMVTNLSTALTTYLFNIMMLKYLGSDGVAAITIVLYAQFLLTALYLGYSSGVAPIISYNYGDQNSIELKKLVRISVIFIIICSLITYFAAIILAAPIVGIFAKVGSNVYEIALNGFGLFSLSYLFIGINIFASALFTALSNGKVSAIISFARTFLFILIAILLLPQIMGVDGIWLSIPFAEVMALIVSIGFVFHFRHVYHYA